MLIYMVYINAYVIEVFFTYLIIIIKKKLHLLQYIGII